MKHEHSKGQQMQTNQRLWQAFVVASQATKTRHPGKTALHHPPARQQDKATLGLWQLHHFQLHAMLQSFLRRRIPRVGLIDEGQLNRMFRHFLHRCRQLAHLSPILLTGRRDMQRQQMTQGIDSQMHFAAFAPFGSLTSQLGGRFPGSIAAFGCQKWPPTALRCAPEPIAVWHASYPQWSQRQPL